MVDALSLCLGDRTDAAVVRHGEKKELTSAPASIYKHSLMFINGLRKEILETWQHLHTTSRHQQGRRFESVYKCRPCTLRWLKEVGSPTCWYSWTTQHHSLWLKKNARKQPTLDAYGSWDWFLQQKSKPAIHCLWRQLKERLSVQQNRSSEQNAKNSTPRLSSSRNFQNSICKKGWRLKHCENEQAFIPTIADSQLKPIQASGILILTATEGQRLLFLHQAINCRINKSTLPPKRARKPRSKWWNTARFQAQEAADSLHHYQDTLEQKPGTPYEE